MNNDYELSEAEIDEQLSRSGMACSRHHRRDFADAFRAISRAIPVPQRVPLPAALAPELLACDRAHLASLSVERRAELEWPL